MHQDPHQASFYTEGKW